jgi:hypothetical protein
MFAQDVAPAIPDQTLAFSSGDPTRGSECADGELGDGEGVRPLLAWPAHSLSCGQDDLPSHPPSLPGTLSPTVRSRHLRC